MIAGAIRSARHAVQHPLQSSRCNPVVRAGRHATPMLVSARRGPGLVIADRRVGAVRVGRRNPVVVACPYQVSEVF